MSVLIKGMDMPEYCEACPCYDWKEDICRITESPNDFSDTRISDCPLVEIPKPHGRLIDADKLLEAMCEAVEKDRHWVNFFAIVEEAPTIIEAEVSE